ncbi:MAG: 5-(carboxyamino)imidazole ribonucleotide synthase [Candidatus Dactylopiibacterium carminicum]|uniref:N5-carboxyaminoimidazole ribonucleotide synthase n=1 Tax=Candidatus Dactylopiibacterium carminicum TaxID=857335 RepID=A0A272EMK8_9RHOO|nr:5-(carboxyamino)imidazole ribonucleotide synthase [Candidatus Dactylopiibacterium carminicum]KAF7597764.1 5-(carboxyamino)imidazole ribonucleotide synthase [Candidatus Dactylopiibacterium carminicum]PAS91353.1 MAG: 5-(carboxyamino)imidazole ribonucleotide synthase [Candidatus Dactylopiibacterium carminicum]PAS92270.1 MAG: 5-(carboxyamino)imidazole ribonucleotide synthase [Candidatus Dactylopiibacterium carminicum]PAS95427.1 MAG: 5-(carboxyamino)imidazole ribonucleotide synthase [Candidatus D
MIQIASPILPPATLGMLGGGQLGRFFVLAAHEMGYQVWVLDPDPASPAGKAADRHLCVAYDDQAALDEIASQCAAVTTEFENVPAATLKYLARSVPVRPNADAVAICQNRVAEKTFLRDNGIPHAAFASIERLEDLRTVEAALFPGILKVARFGYDGKGQARVANREEAMAAFQAFNNEACVLEQMLKLDYEVSVVLARDEHGACKCFPVAENQHARGILDISVAPARASVCQRDSAQEIAERLAEKLGYIGTLGVEFFVSRGELYVNEMAPRPHNSGHYTVDACVTSQYEQQVRALCGLPLGDARAHSAAVMVNLLGDAWFDEAGNCREPDWARLFAVPGLKLHLYGKHEARPGRKMGHYTVIDADPQKAFDAAMAVRAALGIKDE